MATIGRGQVHVDHLQRSKLFQHGPWRQPRCQSATTLFQCYLQAVGHKGDEDIRLNAFIALMVNRPNGQVALEFFKRLLDFGELELVLPKPGRIDPGEIGAEQVTALAPAYLAQLVFAQ